MKAGGSHLLIFVFFKITEIAFLLSFHDKFKLFLSSLNNEGYIIVHCKAFWKLLRAYEIMIKWEQRIPGDLVLKVNSLFVVDLQPWRKFFRSFFILLFLFLFLFQDTMFQLLAFGRLVCILCCRWSVCHFIFDHFQSKVGI